MVDILQLLGVGYLAFMLYLTFLYYKKNQYTIRNFIFWAVVWGGGILMLLFPATTSLLTQQLKVGRVLDFYLILGLMFFSIITFMSFATARKTEARVEALVRRLALSEKKRKK